MTSIFSFILLALAFTIAGATYDKTEKDFMSEPMQRAVFTPDDFVFKFEKPDSETPNGNLRPRTVAQSPVLATLPGDGVGQNLVTIEACGLNQPHVHPRGTEISFITKGELFFGFLEENGGRFINATMKVGQSIAIPQGLMHFAQNRGCKEAQFLANFPHRDPGTQTIASNFFRLPQFVLRATLGIDDQTIRKVAKAAVANKNPSVDPECLKRCGIKRYSSK